MTLALSLALVGLGCRAAPPPPPPSGDGETGAPSLLVQEPVPAGEERESMEALASGRLELSGGCFVLRGAGGSTHAIVWPPGFRVDGGAVVSPDGGQPLRPGDEVRLSGGEVSGAEALAPALREPARRCPPPYWLVGETAERI